MNVDHVVEKALDRAGCAPPATVQAFAGGGSGGAVLLKLQDGGELVAKLAATTDAALLHEERRGLDALRATATVRVPLVIDLVETDDGVVLLMEHLRQGATRSEDWDAFGTALAALHAVEAGGRYGFGESNHIGATPQCNTWEDDWITFNRVHRIGPQLELAKSRGLLRRAKARIVEEVVDALDLLLPPHPRPSLLHGDLWSGNVLPLATGGMAVIDPACSVGDGWADIAMLTLFGGTDGACIEAYALAHGDTERLDSRLGVYQLYHVLNHANLFGGGYVDQAVTLAKRLVGSVTAA